MSGRLAGKVAIVTGGAGVFGRSIVSRMLDEGACVSSWDIATHDPHLFHDLDRGISLTVDVGDPDAVKRATCETRERLGDIDVLVNNAARALPALAWELTQEEWHRHLTVNLTGAFQCIQAVMPSMIERRGGAIINIGSLAAQQGRPFTSPAYAASKGGLLGLTVSLSRHLAEFGITVNAINPGIFPHKLHDAFTPDQLASLVSDIPLRRRSDGTSRGRPEDIANAVLFLAGPEAEYITGAFLNVNGGSRTA